MKQRINFESLAVGTDFHICWSSLQYTKVSKSSAKVYNDFDEYVGREHFKPSDIVELES
jgi:hypothetical protein